MSAPAVVHTLPAAIVAEINAEHEQAFGKAREAIEHARRAGELLLQAKAQVAHGAWLPWLASNVKFSERTARGYMRLASHWNELQTKTATVADLGLRDALGLLAEPRPEAPADPDAAFRARLDSETAEREEIFRQLEAGSDPAPLLKRLGELMSEDYWDRVLGEAAAIDLSNQYQARAKLAAEGYRITEKLIPKLGEMVYGVSRDRSLYVAPSEAHPGFFFVVVLTHFDSGNAVAESCNRPVAKFAVRSAVKAAGFVIEGAVLMRKDCAPWDVNIFFERGRDYVQAGAA